MCRGRRGELNSFVTFISATREVLLPTELGSVIADVVDAGGIYYPRAIHNVDGEWEAVNAYGSTLLRPEEIASWAECQVEVLR